VKWFEVTPVIGLLLICVGLTIWAGPVMAYMESTASALHDSAAYVGRAGSVQPAPAGAAE
jgi:multicomponent K+:H+ antiporter subunit D